MQVEDRRIGEGEVAVATAVDGLLVVLFNREPTELSQPPGEPATLYGKLGELALRTADFDRAVAFWTAVGYRELHAADEPYPRGIAGEDPPVLGSHTLPADEVVAFAGATLTYFAPDIPDGLDAIRAADLTLVREFPDDQGVVSGVLLEASGGKQLLLFQGDV